MLEQPKYEGFLTRAEALPKTPVPSDKDLETLKEFIREMSSDLREESLPVDKNARINMGQFNKAYDLESIKSDRDLVSAYKERWKNAAVIDMETKYGWRFNREQIVRLVEERIRMGEVWEMLSTAILHKNLGEDFIVVRTSEYDDFCHKAGKVDNLILDKKTGHIVCAFDEVVTLSGEESDERLKEKKDSIMQKNWRDGGADLKYGVYLEKEGDKMKLKKGRIENLPVFYLAISAEDLTKALGDPAAEKKIFQDMIASMQEQIGTIKKEPLNAKLKARLDFFQEVFKNR